MYAIPLSAPQKVGVVLFGLAAGAGATVATAAASCLLGFMNSFLASYTGWPRLGKSQAWLPIVGLFSGFYFGIVVGGVVCWKVCRTRLGGPPTE
jgi:hypothetical protein